MSVAPKQIEGNALQGKKTATVTGFIADTNQRDVDLGTHCSGTASGTVKVKWTTMAM